MCAYFERLFGHGQVENGAKQYSKIKGKKIKYMREGKKKENLLKTQNK
jgi:hypothetical protein